MANAASQLMYAFKDILELAGLSLWLYTLLATLHALPPLPEFVRTEQHVTPPHTYLC